MVKLDVSILRHLSKDDFRVLLAVELGMKNHELVPTKVIETLAQLKRGGFFKCIENLHKHKLIYHESKIYDGYRLTYSGYDFLALKTLANKKVLAQMGNQIGTGKESDVFIGLDNDKSRIVVKIHRLGRTSFRSIKRNRDYHKNIKHTSWLYLSKLAALKEFSYMKALYEHGFQVPKPIETNRHIVVMEYKNRSVTLSHVSEMKNPHQVYDNLMNMIVSLAEHGLIHGDFNEFNLLIDEDENVTMIDFPQMISIDHPNAEEYFNRDIEGVKQYFKKRFNILPDETPVFSDIKRKYNLDKEIAASGFSKDLEKEFQSMLDENEENNNNSSDEDEDINNNNDEEEEEEVEDED